MKSRFFSFIGGSAINLADAGVDMTGKHSACLKIYFAAVMNAKLLLMFPGRHPSHAEKL